MKVRLHRYSTGISLSVAAGFVLVFLAAFPIDGAAQTNTFPSSGSVGIGTLSPSLPLDVVGPGTFAGPVYSSGVDAVFVVYDRSTSGIAAFYRTGEISRLWDSSAGDVITFNSSGNVGIGTTSPASKLDVNGDVTVSGNISAKYQDLAEWVPAEKAMAAGTVVILDSKKINSVMPSSKAYDTHVAGVVSGSPGIVLGVAADDKVKVATTGRVKVHVDASQGAINVGDLLVTSDKEGMARKSDPLNLGGVEIHRPGTLIGKALEPLKEGEGEILVLLSLQ